MEPLQPREPRTLTRRSLLRPSPKFEPSPPTPAITESAGPLLLRYSGRPDGRSGVGVPAAPTGAVVTLNRLGYGPRPGDLSAFAALGSTFSERLANYVAEQLDPDSIDDSAADARLATAGYTTLGKSLTQLWSDHVVPNPEWEIRMQPFFETERAAFLRAVYSKRQLFELMVEFWHNHFSVFAFDFEIGPTWVHTDQAVIRPNALGNFRTMLEGIAQSPGMLYYLDNRDNSADGPNENYARELLELHTLGAEAFYGAIPASEVPLDGQGRPLGYCDEDVTEAARCLTGWTLRDRYWNPDFGNTGEFFVYEDWHDTGSKRFLGVDLPSGRGGLMDGQDLLDIIAEHPATGRFVATKLCRRLIGDSPPQSVVDQAATLFTAQAGASDQIAQVVELIALSPEFAATWADKVKRPFEIIVSALRAANANWNFALSDEDTDVLLWLYDKAGQPLFAWHPPNGFPDVKAAWTSTSPRVMSWRTANWLVDVEDAADVPRLNAYGQTPVGTRSAEALVDFWSQRIFARAAPSEERAELIAFMAQGFNPTLDLPLDTDTGVQTRLQALVGLMFMSPTFLWR